MLRLSDHTPEGAMAPQGEAGVPATLSRWVREIVGAIPGPARSTIAELILGALLGGGGHVTQAILALTPRLGWQAYHWMIEHGRFRLLGLVAALCGIVRRETCGPRRFVIIDDGLAPRCSAKAPGAAMRFDHARKPNRPAFLLCQAFVALAAVVPCRDRPRAVPIVTGLCRAAGHAGKIALAKGLLRAVGDRLGPLCVGRRDPGADAGHRHEPTTDRILAHDARQSPVQGGELRPQGGARAQHRLGQRLQHRVPGDQLAGARLEPAFADGLADLQA